MGDETKNESESVIPQPAVSSLDLRSITDGSSQTGIPQVRFVQDIGAFADTFSPPASPELLIGAFSELFAKYKNYETSLIQKSSFS